MEELLFLTSQTDFLRNGLILYSGVNIAWLLLFCGNPSQTQSCWRTKSQYTLWPWPVNKAPPHPSFLDFLSSRDPSLLLPFFHFPLPLQSGFAYTNIGARSCPGAFLQTSASFSSFIHLPLCSQVPLIKLCGTYTNRQKQARKVVGNAGSMTLMRSLWLATQPKTNLPPSHLHPQLHWFLLDHACRRKPTQSEKAVVNIQRTRGWDTKGTADLDDQFSVQYMRHRPNTFYFWSSLNIWDQTCIKVTPENSLWRPCRAVSAVPLKASLWNLQVGAWRLRMYGYNNGTSSGDRVSTVINHALWFWPHQGLNIQEVGTLNGTTYTKGSAPQEGLISRPRCPGTDARPWGQGAARCWPLWRGLWTWE